MIKNLEKDLRTYRKDTFITSFFATITILLIVLIICSVPAHAQSIDATYNGGTPASYDNDSSNMVTLSDQYSIDTSLTSPTGVLNLEDSNVDILKDGTNLRSSKNVYFLSDSSVNGNTQANNFINSTNYPKTFIYDGVTYNLSDFPNFVLCSHSATLSSGIFPDLCISKGDFCYYMTGRYLAGYELFSSSADSFLFYYNANNGTFSIRKSILNTIDYGSNYDNFTVDAYNCCSWSNLLYSNASVKGILYTLNSNENGVQYVSADGTEYNYLLGQAGNGGSSSGGETPGNNLVMSNGDWIFKNSKYSAPYDSSFPTGSIYPSGSVSFSFDPTEYQSTNPSAFELVFTFYFQYDVDYKNWNQAFSVFEQTSQLLNNTKRYSHTYNFNDNGTVEIILPLSEFIENGNSKSWTWQDIFDKLENGAFTSVLNNSRELYSVSYNKFDLTATAYIKTSDSKSGNITEWYNPMNKKGYTTDDSGGLNKNPYVPSADSDPNNSNSNNNGGNAPGDAGNNGSSTTTSNGGNVTVYNYNTNNNNNSLSSEGNTFNDVFNSMLGNNKITSESIADSTGTNGFITFMNNTINSVPTSFFTALLTFFVTCLGILIVAFILRMLLDIL